MRLHRRERSAVVLSTTTGKRAHADAATEPLWKWEGFWQRGGFPETLPFPETAIVVIGYSCIYFKARFGKCIAIGVCGSGMHGQKGEPATVWKFRHAHAGSSRSLQQSAETPLEHEDEEPVKEPEEGIAASSSSNAALDTLFHRLDTDGSGDLDYQELLDGMESMISMLKLADMKSLSALFQALDVNGDGTISLDEFREGHSHS